MRVLARGKKLGALVGFTFRQPAVLQALGLSNKSRQLGSYLMYEPFQRAWTQTVKPSQTITLCEGGGVIFRHPRVQVALWLDHYVTEIYPNWTRNGNSLLQLATLAAQRQPLSVRASKPVISPGSSKNALKTSGSSAPSNPTSKTTTSSAPSKNALKMTALPAPSNPTSNTATSSAPSKPASKATASSGSSNAPLKPIASSGPSKPTVVIDLTGTTSSHKPLKRRRAFVPPVQFVDIMVEEDSKQSHRKRARMSLDRVKLDGKGTSSDPYVL